MDIAADPRTLSARDVITRTEYALAGRFATITTVDSYTADDPHPTGTGSDPV